MDRSSTSRPRIYPSAPEHGAAGPQAGTAAGPTSHLPSWEGRRLVRPGEDIEDQGLSFDIATVVSRRGALGALGAGSVTAVLAACSSGNASDSATTGRASDAGSSADSDLTEMPGETAGPYPGDGSNGANVLETSGVERADLRSSIDSDTTADGVPLEITMNIIDMADGDVPMVGAAVYLWQCDAAGRYSLYSEGLENETYLRGVQIADDAGAVTFSSIFPGCYAGRWPHLHFEVFPDAEAIVDADNAILTSQIALPQEESAGVYELEEYAGSAENLGRLTLESDNVFSDGWDQQLASLTGALEDGYAFSIDVPIDTSTEPEGGGAPDQGGPGESGHAPAGGPPAGDDPPPEDGEGDRPAGEPPAEDEGDQPAR